MPFLPAHCPHCGIIFTPPAIGIGGNAQLTLRNATTNCPKCGGRARLVEGTFAASAERLVPVAGPPITFAILAALERAVEEAKRQQSDAKKLVKEIEKISPELAVILRPLIKYKTSTFILALVILLIHSLRINLDVDLNKLIQQSIIAVEDRERSSPEQVNVQQVIYESEKLNSPSQITPRQHRKRLHQPQLRPKKKQGKIGPRHRPKRKRH